MMDSNLVFQSRYPDTVKYPYLKDRIVINLNHSIYRMPVRKYLKITGFNK